MIVRATKRETELLFRDRLDKGNRFERYKKRFSPEAAISYVASSGISAGAGSTSVNIGNWTSAIGQVTLCVGCSNLSNLTLTLTSSQLTSINKLGTWNDSTNAMTIAVWTAVVSTASASANVTVTATGGSPGATAGCIASYTGVNTSTLYEGWNNGAFNVGSGVLGYTGNVTVFRADDYLVCLFAGLTSASDASWGVSSGYTNRAHTVGGSPSMGVALIDKASGGSGTFNGGTSVTANWQGQGIIVALQTPGSQDTASMLGAFSLR